MGDRIAAIAGWLRLIFSVGAVVYAILLVWCNRTTVAVDYVWGTVEMPVAAVFVCGAGVGIVAWLLRVPLQRLASAVFAELAARAAPREASTPTASSTIPTSAGNGSTAGSNPTSSTGSNPTSGSVSTAPASSATGSATSSDAPKVDPAKTSMNIAVGRFSALWDRLKKGEPP